MMLTIVKTEAPYGYSQGPGKVSCRCVRAGSHLQRLSKTEISFFTFNLHDVLASSINPPLSFSDGEYSIF